MFSRRFPQARRRLTAVALLLLASFCSGPFVVPHVDPGGDAEWSGAAVAHDAAAHRVGEAADTDRDEHCAVCHLVRTTFSSSKSSHAIAAGHARVSRVNLPAVLPALLSHWSTGPERAPPA